MGGKGGGGHLTTFSLPRGVQFSYVIIIIFLGGGGKVLIHYTFLKIPPPPPPHPTLDAMNDWSLRWKRQAFGSSLSGHCNGLVTEPEPRRHGFPKANLRSLSFSNSH